MPGTILVHHERCVACRRCRIACIVEHSESKDLFEVIHERRAGGARISIRPAGRSVVPVACRHCDAAACIMACPSGALARSAPGEPVVLDPELCVGCRNCVIACPYGAPHMSARRAEIVKCDLCIERLSRGEAPACVEACPTGTLTFRDARDARERLQRGGEWTFALRPGP